MEEITEFELDGVHKAIMILAKHAERCPYNEYKVKQEVMDALGIERIAAQPPKDIKLENS